VRSWRILVLAVALSGGAACAADLFPLQDVRLHAGPFLDAQQTDLRYLLALDPDRLAAPFLREAGLTPRKLPYGNWESSGLDGHMGGHYLSALALMSAATGDAEVRRRLDDFVAELKRAQDANSDGYLGGIPGGRAAWAELRAGQLRADSFSVNGKWVPWYNLHKTFAGLRDAWLHAGNGDARTMLVRLADWTLDLTAHLSDAQMQDMLRAEQGGMNEVLADVSRITGDLKYLQLARRFSQRALLEPLEAGEDRLSGLHANTQIPKVIGFERIGEMTGDEGWLRAARFFWRTVVEHRTVAIGGNSVNEHFHTADDFRPMIEEVQGPETCNTYNMLKLTGMLFQRAPAASYADFYERALYNHILASQRPGGGFVYFTPMRPNHYRVYSQVDQAMWCCVGTGIESHAKYGEFIYAHDGDRALYVNLYAPSEVRWRGLRIEQQTRFPDSEDVRIAVTGAGRFVLRLRRPAWVSAGAMRLRVNGVSVPARVGKDGYVSIERAWRDGDTVDLRLPMHLRLERMPDQSDYYAVLYGPVVLAAKSRLFEDERLNVLADDSRMGHVPGGQVCPLDAAPTFVSNRRDFERGFRPVPGKPLTFTAPGLVRGERTDRMEFIPFFRLHDVRYTVYFPYATPAGYAQFQEETAAREKDRLALDARTIDQVAPGEQQPEVEHGLAGEGLDAGTSQGRHWRRADGWFSYRLQDAHGEGRVLRLIFAAADAGRQFDVYLNGALLAQVSLEANPETFYDRDLTLPADAVRAGALEVKLVAHPGSAAGPLYGLRLLRE